MTKLHCAIVMGAVLGSAAPCAAQMKVEAHHPGAEQSHDGTRPSLWRSHWPTFSAWEGAATLAAGVGTVALFMTEPTSEPRWRGGVLFDDAARDAVRLESKADRKKARRIGDFPYYAAPVLPLLVDPLIAAWAVHGDSKAALNLQLVGLEAFSYAGLLSFASLRGVARERPDSTECRRQNPGDLGACESDTESFWSGHTAIAAASAGLTCANHTYMPLWGHPIADAGACALATGGALATGASRVAGDRHYLTDVLTGFGVGFGVGYAVPTLLHYTRGKSKPDLTVSVDPGGGCLGACLKVAGTF